MNRWLAVIGMWLIGVALVGFAVPHSLPFWNYIGIMVGGEFCGCGVFLWASGWTNK